MRISIEPYFGNWYWIAAMAAVLIIAGWMWRDPQLNRRQNIIQTLLRTAALLCVCLLLLRPAVTYSLDGGPTSLVAVLLDRSASMSLPSGIRSESRYTVAREVLKAIEDIENRLPPETRLALGTFAEQLSPLRGNISPAAQGSTIAGGDSMPDGPSAFLAAVAALPAEADGQRTDLIPPLQMAATRAEDPPVRAVVWLTDGIQTAEADGTTPQGLTRQLTRGNVPLWIVGIGPRSGVEGSLDQWVDGLPEQVEAFSKNVVDLRGLLRTTGLQGRDLTLQTTLKDASGRVLNQETQTVRVDRPEQVLPFVSRVTAPDPGAYEVDLVALGIDGEATLYNNRLTTFMNVRSVGSRVLYIEGQPRVEQKFIRRSLADSPDLQIDYLNWLANGRDKWPIDLSARVDLSLYDAFIIGDVDSSAFLAGDLRRIAERVSEGSGLMTLGGYHSYAAGGYDETPLAEVLPIELTGTRQPFDEPPIAGNHLEPPVRLVPVGNHPVFDTSNSAEPPTSAATDTGGDWSQLPPLLGANRWRAIKAALGVDVIAESDAGDPLAVAATYGDGRVLSLAFDSSYQWWLFGNKTLHRSFWRQAVLWVMQPDQPPPGFEVVMDRRRFLVGDSAAFQVNWRGGDPSATMPSDVQVQLQRIGAPPQSQPFDRESPRILNGQTPPLDAAGRYELVVSGSQAGESYRVRFPFDVLDDAIERVRGNPDWALLNQLAAINADAGGILLSPDQTDVLQDLILQHAADNDIELVESRTLGDGEFDAWAAFLVIFALLGVQWILRKRWNVV